MALGIIKLLLNCELAYSTEQGKKDSRKGRKNTQGEKMEHLTLRRTQLWTGPVRVQVFS